MLESEKRNRVTRIQDVLDNLKKYSRESGFVLWRVKKENERSGQEKAYIKMKVTGEEDVSFQFPNCDSLGSG